MLDFGRFFRNWIRLMMLSINFYSKLNKGDRRRKEQNCSIINGSFTNKKRARIKIQPRFKIQYPMKNLV